MDLDTIGSLLGHSDRSATEIYAHITDNRQRAALSAIPCGKVVLETNAKTVRRMRTAPCNSSEFSLFRIFFNLLYYRQVELCIPQFFEEAGLFVISRSTVQIRVLAPEITRVTSFDVTPFSVLSARPFLQQGNLAPLLKRLCHRKWLMLFP